MAKTVTIVINAVVAIGAVGAFLSGLLGHERDWLRTKRRLGARCVRLAIAGSAVIAVLFFLPYLYLSHQLADWGTYPSRVIGLETLFGLYFGILYWAGLFVLGHHITLQEEDTENEKEQDDLIPKHVGDAFD